MERRKIVVTWLLLAMLPLATKSKEVSQKEDYPTFQPASNNDNNNNNNISVPVCCGDGKKFNMSDMTCVDSVAGSLIQFYERKGVRGVRSPEYEIIEGFPNCTSYTLDPDIPDDEFYVLYDGTLLLPGNPDIQIDTDDYCLLDKLSANQFSALVCFQEEDGWVENTVYQLVFPIILLISSIFLILTLIVHIIIPELRDILGTYFICAIFCLILAHLSTVSVQLANHVLSSPLCVFLGVMMHFWYLCAFLWLNVISFHICSTTVWKKNTHTQNKGCCLLASCVYAFGIALVVCTVAVVRDFSGGSMDTSPSILPEPGFGELKCFFSDDRALIVYFYGPVAVILTLNVLLFICAAYKLCTLSKHSQTNKFQLSLYLKLFVIMGISWISEVCSYFSQRETNTLSSPYIWLIFDLINALQGTIIFFLFVCREKVLIRIAEIVFGKVKARRIFPTLFADSDCLAGGGGDETQVTITTK